MNKIEQELIIRDLDLEQLQIVRDGVYNFRCPVCGDSQKVKHKKRGFFFWKPDKGKYFFKCHNCGAAHSLDYFLKYHYPEIYHKFVFSNFITKDNNVGFTLKEKKHFDKIYNDKIKKYLNWAIAENIITNCDKKMPEKAKDYLEDRKIPKEKYSKMYYTDNFMEFLFKPLKHILNEKINENKDYEKDERIFWFIKNRANDIIGIQGRSISGSPIRYLTVKINPDEVMIGNIENVAINETVFVTEGYIDSLFLDNCISLNGSENFNSVFYKLQELNVKNIVIVFDNEPQNKQIKELVRNAIDKSITNDDMKIGICLLPQEMRRIGKDINQYIKKGISKSKLINIINENTFFAYEAKVRLIRW